MREKHFRDNPAVILKSAVLGVNAMGVIEETKRFSVLAFVPPQIRSGAKSTFSPPPSSSRGFWVRGDTDAVEVDVAIDAVPPLWPPRIEELEFEGLTYELSIVPITSIALVTRLTMKVRPPPSPLPPRLPW